MSEVSVNKKGISFFKIVVVIFLLVITGLISVVGYYVVFNKKTTDASAVVKVPFSEAEAYVDTEEFIVNLADEGTRRYLKTKLEIAYPKKNKKLALELEEKKNIIRDVIIGVATTKKADEMTSKGKEDMKTELRDRINVILTEGKISEVYYIDIFIQ